MQPFDFFKLLYGGAVTQGEIEIRLLPSRTRQWMHWPTYPQRRDVFKPENAPSGQDVYFGVALRNEQTDGKAANCKPTRLIWSDVDLVDHPEITGGQSKDGLLSASAEELSEYKAELLSLILERCASHGLAPRAIVDSGHGLQVYFARLAASNNKDTERFNKAVTALLGGDDKSTDIARILRVPATYNLKNASRPLPVSVVYVDETALVDDERFEALPIPVKERAEPLPVLPEFKPERSDDLVRNYAQAAMAKELSVLAATASGGRNDQLNRSAFALGTFIGAGVLDELEVKNRLAEVAAQIGLDDDEIKNTISSGLKSGKSKPRDLSTIGKKTPPSAGRGTVGKRESHQGAVAVADLVEEMPDKPTLANYRDLVLASFHERDLIYRYHQIWRNWWQYQNGVYVEVPDEVMAQQVDLTLQSYGFVLANTRINEVLTKLARDPLIGSRDVDQDAWELNCQTGILNLATGEIYEHTPEYFSIIQSKAAYKPDAVAHEWLDFLREAVPDRADRRLLQMFAGLCLTGDTSPQRALLLIGDGGTGKSTFVRVLQAVLGNLATSSALESIKDDSFLISRLVGKRMCVVSELQRNVDWLPFKRVTGEDQIGVDVKNKSPYVTKLDIKLVILANVMPFLGDDVSNNSLMRRFLPVAFNVKPAVPDPTLESRLTAADELSGVLNWMMDGLNLLQAEGMRFPNSDAATLAREIVEESNRVITFLRDECSYAPKKKIGASDLYKVYRQWCFDTGHKPLSSTSFAKQLASAGKHFGKEITKERSNKGVIYGNLAIESNAQTWEAE